MTQRSLSRCFKTSPEVIRLAVMLYVCFPLSLRSVEDLLHELGIEVSRETVRFWWQRFGPMFAAEIRGRRVATCAPPAGAGTWTRSSSASAAGRCTCGGRSMLKGEVLDVLVQPKHDSRAAQKLMRKLLKKQGRSAEAWGTDKCAAYGAALRELNLSRAAHVQRGRANHPAESSHVPVRRREWKQQSFRTPSSAQRILSMQAATYNTFTTPRHLVSPCTHRLFRAEAFECGVARPVWQPETG